MACVQVGPASSQFPNGSCQDQITGNNVDCGNSACKTANPAGAYNASTPPLLAPAGYETYNSPAGPTQVQTLGYYMSGWVQGVIGFPTSIAGLDPLTAATQAAQGYCGEAGGSLPDCTASNIQAYAAQAAAQISAAVANNANNGGYAPPPGANTSGCGGVPCGQTTTAGAPVTNSSNGGVTGSSNVPAINGSASGQPPQTAQTGSAPIATKQGPITGQTVIPTRPVVTNAPSTNQSQAYQPTTGQTIRGAGNSAALAAMNPVTTTTGNQTVAQAGTSATMQGSANTLILVIAVAAALGLWFVLEHK